ncbi:hypothetical protein VIGAN_01251100 [Vigna angularis var. angularis]|uniref:Protein kinase domain-containing protein n=1 Tax=Vigna angularis var. angularis TaxID=157739 RepID=A0A0S3R2B0_PHAAN|nr:hypothetical protein VIGAN_01251100 [Vigna angularis var. angularis]
MVFPCSPCRRLEGARQVVCVTGASDYIASWLVKFLLECGYTVKATVRDTNDPEKVDHLLSLDGANERLHLVKANLLEEGSFYSAVEGCHAVSHTASPFFNDTELLDLAMKGTLNVLKSTVLAMEIARGIMYFHEECEASIIHCDIKPQNILVDEFWIAKIFDFGLAKLLMPDQTRMALEWNKNGPISVKTDVYRYKIMLLEILCCRRNIEVHAPEPEAVSLCSWAYNCFVVGKLNKLFPWEVVDDKTVVENMVKVALWCIQDEPFPRPTMKSVVLILEGVTDIEIPPCPASNST